MADFNWDEQPDADGFDWDSQEDAEPSVSADKPGMLKSFLRGGEQGATFGFADELSGRVAQATDWTQGLFGESPTEMAARMKAEGVQIPEGVPTSRDELYRQTRDEARTEYADAAQANPVSSIAGGLLGGIGMNVIPGLGLARGASTGRVVGNAALQGAAYGAGASEEEDLAGIATDAAISSGVSGLSAGLLKKGADKVASKISSVGKSLEPLAENLALPKQRPDAETLIAAAKRLGIKPTPGMLDDAGFVERLESTIAKSPSIFGQGVRARQREVQEGLASAAMGLTDDATSLSPYQIGEKFKSGVTAEVGERLGPISQVFDDVRESTKNIPISERSKAAVLRNVENLDLMQLTGGEGKPGKYAQMIPRLKNADQVKTMMTLLNNDISAAEGAEKQVLIAIKGKLQSLEKNSIMRAAVNQARTPKEGAGIGRDIVGDLMDARTGYRGLLGDLNEVADASRLKARGGPSAFLDAVDSVPSERVTDKFFNLGNNDQLIALKNKFPEQFNLLRQGRLKELQEAAIDNSMQGRGDFSTQRFLNQVRKLGPEAQEVLFPGQTSKLMDVDTIQKTIPRNFNPSGTASESSWQNALWSNVRDIPNAALYKAISTPKGRIAVMNIEEMLKGAPQRFGKFAGVLQDAARRGSQAVAATNFVLQQSNPEYREMLRGMENESEQ